MTTKQKLGMLHAKTLYGAGQWKCCYLKILTILQPTQHQMLWWSVNKELERMCTQSWPSSWYYPGICLEG
jgi:hypothetical protein